MVIDFVFGGTDYIAKLKDVQSKVGEHRICFAFKFQSGIYYFSRSSVNYKEVFVCDRDYNVKDSVPWSMDKYTSFLQKEYELNLPGLTFRNAIGRFSRIKDAFIDERHPIQQVPLGAKIGCDAFVKDIEGVAANGKTKLQQGRKT